MAKVKTRFVCNACGHVSTQLLGKCPGCKQFNTLEESREAALADSHARRIPGQNGLHAPALPRPLIEVEAHDLARIPTGDSELDRVLGGGLVPGCVILLGGEPGIGKSTLMLQSTMTLAARGLRVLYVGGEESPEQVRMRAERLGNLTADLYILPETNAVEIVERLNQHPPDLLIIDSIQTLYQPSVESAPGSASQIRESAALLTAWAKQHHVPTLMVGHITKEGSLAGPKVLEHLVDVVLQFEGERNHAYRMLRANKNRFGSTSELGLYEMLGTGLTAVENPSDVLLGQTDDDLQSGAAVAAALEGARPMLVEVQALVSTAVYGTPQRSGTGFDVRRLNMLLAVLEKRCGFKLGTLDVFLNIAGGLRITDPALDLAVIAAILSSTLDVPLPVGTAFAGEVGLSGEIRPVSRLNQRVAEASRMGIKRLLVSGHGRLELAPVAGLEVVPVKRVNDLHGVLF